jgi:hypothetical protein
LGRAAFNLARRSERIHNAAAVVNRDESQDADVPHLGVDLNFREMRAETEPGAFFTDGR